MEAPTSPGSGSQGSTVGILRAGAGSRAQAKSLQIGEFKFVGGAALPLFFATALKPLRLRTHVGLGRRRVVVVFPGPNRVWGLRMPHGGPDFTRVERPSAHVGDLAGGSGRESAGEVVGNERVKNC